MLAGSPSPTVYKKVYKRPLPGWFTKGSQAHEGWNCLSTRYDDGGFTGGNMERPALQRLLADIGDGKVDLVVCYKVDRLSRSLLDFAKMMQAFERHGVSFVSVTQQFNTAPTRHDEFRFTGGVRDPLRGQPAGGRTAGPGA
jgi:DNA invertase Pin-like site-specific DNA recombinase